MKTAPSLIVVADRGHLIAYRRQDNRSMQPLETLDIKEALLNLSEQVTDQAGSFPNSGGYGTSTAERLPLKEELQQRALRQLSEKIDTLCADHSDGNGNGAWALVAPSEINEALLSKINRKNRDKLTVNLRVDLVHSSPREILDRVEAEAAK